jgi:hypothetical protein
MQFLRISAISVSVAMNKGFNWLPNALAGARKYYEEALRLHPDGPYAQEAKERLRKLKKK